MPPESPTQQTIAAHHAEVSAPQNSRLFLLLLCFTLSGFAGLVYQTAWSQRFALVFGASELAVATVLAAYMAGLALGAAAAGHFGTRVRRPVLGYALLEFGIALTALAVPIGLALANRLQVALFGNLALPPDAGSLSSSLFYLLTSFVILLPPTALMGATLPLLVQHVVHHDEEIGPRIGLLYTMNTLGAAAGTLAGAFLLLPHLGLRKTVLVAVAINGLVFLCAAALDRLNRRGHNPPSPTPTKHRTTIIHWILPVMLVSGMVSFTYEVLWTRLLTHVLGASVYAFGTMLATFLTGLALGAGLAARLAVGRNRARSGFLWSQIAIAFFSTTAFVLMDHLPQLSLYLNHQGISSVISGAVLSSIILLPGAMAIGATFPFAVRILARSAADAQQASARIFAWNTCGAILGAIGCGFFLLPLFQYTGTVKIATTASLTLALVAAVMYPRKRLWIPALSLGLLLTIGIPLKTPWKLLSHSPLKALLADTTAPLAANQRSSMANQPILEDTETATEEVAFYAVGRSANVLLLDQAMGWRLTTNGLPEAIIQRPGAHPGELLIARWLSFLPILARPETRSMFVVGLGGGTAVEEIPATVETVEVVELESEVIVANRSIADRRRKDPLSDPRIRLITNDARSALHLSQRRFDAIVSQPSHPWTAGASHLFTREFFALVRSRLQENGVFVQWIGLAFVDEALLRSLVATLADVFPHLEVYLPYNRAILFLASSKPLNTTENAERTLRLLPQTGHLLSLRSASDILLAKRLSSVDVERFAAHALINTDGQNFLKTRSPKIFGAMKNRAAIEALFAPFDRTLSALAQNDEALNAARRLLASGDLARLNHLTEQMPPGAARLTARALRAVAAGKRSAAERLLRQALQQEPTEKSPLHVLLELYRPAIEQGQNLRFLARLTEDPEATLVEGWQQRGNRNWNAIQRLEPRLAMLRDRQHALYADTLRLRAEWRLNLSTTENVSTEILIQRGQEAQALLEELLGANPRPGDILLSAEAAIQAQDHSTALARLEALLNTFRKRHPQWLRGRTQKALTQISQASLSHENMRRFKVVQQRLRPFMGTALDRPSQLE